METPQLLQLSSAQRTAPTLVPVKLLRLREPAVSVEEWEAVPRTLVDVLKARNVPKASLEDAQCQANIQIDPLSDLVKKHIRETPIVSMRFTEVTDISEEDYRPPQFGPGKSSNPSKFLTKAEWIQPLNPEDPMKHYKDTWEFQTKWMRERLRQCEKVAGNLEEEIQIQQEDFRKLAIQTHVIKENKEEQEKQENAREMDRTEELLSANKALLAEVEDLFARRREATDPLDLVPVKEEPERPSTSPRFAPQNPALTKRLTSAFDTASKAVRISSASKPLKVTVLKPRKPHPKESRSSHNSTSKGPLVTNTPFFPESVPSAHCPYTPSPYTNLTSIRFKVMESDHKPLLKDPAAEISSEELSLWFQQDNVRTGQSLHRLEAVLGLTGLCTLLGTSMRIGVANDQLELTHRRRL